MDRHFGPRTEVTKDRSGCTPTTDENRFRWRRSSYDRRRFTLLYAAEYSSPYAYRITLNAPYPVYCGAALRETKLWLSDGPWPQQIADRLAADKQRACINQNHDGERNFYSAVYAQSTTSGGL